MAAVVASHHGGFWQQQQRRQTPTHMPPMPMSTMIPSFGGLSRPAPGPPVTNGFQTARMDVSMPLFQNPQGATTVPFQSGLYAFDNMSVNPYSIQQPFNVPYQSTLPQNNSYTTPSSNQALPLVREARNTLPMPHMASVKSETQSPVQPSQIFPPLDGGDQQQSIDPESTVNFSTDVDTLMKAIQAKSKPQRPPPPPPQVSAPAPSGPEKMALTRVKGSSNSKPKKRYQCTETGCFKSFYQKTHLEIHNRAHTGHKPFLCKEPSCGQRFSQLGNLKTHERRHTGERPYTCDICGKTFAQRGNVRAHKIVHQHLKPFTCKLDDCGKQFTQLGNLKSHQNKFHSTTLRVLTQKFASIREGDPVTAQDKELWEYFASLYKNSNKGIKGRGKDRRIATIPSSAASTASASSTKSAGTLAPASKASNLYGSDRDSIRSMSTSTEHEEKMGDAPPAYDFTASGHDGVGAYHQPPSLGYSDMVFPERKMY